MKGIFCFLNYILFLILIISINSQINKTHKERVKACITLHEKKFERNEQKLDEFLNNRSEIYKGNKKKLILLTMAYCYDKMSFELAKKINRINFRNLNPEELGIKDIYDIEKYNYDDQERNSKIYDNFISAFNAVVKEIKEDEKRMSKNDKFQIYFVHTKLFKIFLYYTIINSIIVFYIRLKDPSKYIDTTKNYVKNNKNNNKKDDEDEDSIEENTNANKDNDKTNNNNNNDNFRKLKKKGRLGKIKKN